jgi:hypothetical protein
MLYKTVEVDVEVHLKEFSDDEIKEEYKLRFDDELEDKDILETMYHAYMNNNPKAADMMFEYVCDKLGRVL